MDLAVGFWAEMSLSKQDFSYTNFDYKSMLNAGIDYTFGLGNGLNMMVEGFGYLQGDSPFANDEGLAFGLLSATYPVNIINNVSAMVFYDFTRLR